MNVAAVDVSGSIEWNPTYKEKVFEVLKTLKPPISVIRWNNSAKMKEYSKIVPEMGKFVGNSGTNPITFLKMLIHFTKGIQLYVFTDGQFYDYNVKECKTFLENQKLLIDHVHLYYIGNEKDMNLKFIEIFEGIPQKVHINEQDVGRVEPEINFDDIDYDYIMKDDSFKATILSKLMSKKVSPDKLKKEICCLSSRILKHFFKDKISIRPFYDTKNVDDCVAYVKKHSYYASKSDFQRKISDILNLFEKGVDIYSLKCFNDVEKTEFLTYQEPDLECQYLTCDILYTKCKTGCIPIKECKDDVWFEKNVLQDPFKMLESTNLVKRVVDLIEPYVMEYGDAYKNIKHPNISPFSRDVLRGVYVLHNDTIPVKDLIQHNNYVLSTFFNNKLPGKPVLWHMIFLYILATERFTDLKERFFEEIRFLGDHADYFITLNPHTNPPIVETLNVCFWYLANVCHKAFPNNKKNILRYSKFNSDIFLRFYKDVYDLHYEEPEKLPLWKLWKTLCLNKYAIYPILTHYYHSEKLNVEGPCQYILYREMKSAERQHKDLPPTEFNYLNEFDLSTVLSIYKKVTKEKYSSPYDEITFKLENVNLMREVKNQDDKLDHIKINIITCHPLVICPITKKHWKDCIGEYDVMRESYLRLFRKYCIKYRKYPESGSHLLMFINEYIFNRQNYMPELFPLSIKDIMDKIMDIFREVMDTYSCENYIKRTDKYSSERNRLEYDELV